MLFGINIDGYATHINQPHIRTKPFFHASLISTFLIIQIPSVLFPILCAYVTTYLFRICQMSVPLSRKCVAKATWFPRALTFNDALFDPPPHLINKLLSVHDLLRRWFRQLSKVARHIPSSIVFIVAASSLSANSSSSGIPSNSPRLRNAPVHAKINATELEDVFSPLRYL